MDGKCERLRLRTNDRQATTEDKQLAVARLGGIAEQHIDPKACWSDEFFKVIHISTIRGFAPHPSVCTPD